MESETHSKQELWIIGGCSLLLILVCIIPQAFGASGILHAKRVIMGSQVQDSLLPAHLQHGDYEGSCR